jgi:hypothetical protein
MTFILKTTEHAGSWSPVGSDNEHCLYFQGGGFLAFLLTEALPGCFLLHHGPPEVLPAFLPAPLERLQVLIELRFDAVDVIVDLHDPFRERGDPFRDVSHAVESLPVVGDTLLEGGETHIYAAWVHWRLRDGASARLNGRGFQPAIRAGRFAGGGPAVEAVGSLEGADGGALPLFAVARRFPSAVDAGRERLFALPAGAGLLAVEGVNAILERRYPGVRRRELRACRPEEPDDADEHHSVRVVLDALKVRHRGFRFGHVIRHLRSPLAT